VSVGRTRDAGWQIGVSKTLPHPVATVWSLLTSPRGIALWLGSGARLGGPGERYETAAGTTGEIRSLHDRDRVRLTWRPEGWDHDTTVQVTVTDAGDGRTVLRFHQEWLAGADERERQREHWQAVMARVVEALG